MNQESKEFRNELKRYCGWTDEEVDKYILKNNLMVKYFKNHHKMLEYKMVAKVIKSENCNCRLKEGDKFVFTADGVLLADESTATPCLWALSPLYSFNLILYNRFTDGLDPVIFPNRVKCLDVGVPCGGWGEVLFEVSCIKEPIKGWGDYMNRRYISQKKT